MTRVRQRIEVVLNYAITSEYRQCSNPAVWKGVLSNVLPSPNKIAKVEHPRALAIDAMHDFMADLRQRQGNAARCLEFVVLTAARSGEARGATWSEIDLEKRLWIVPGEGWRRQMGAQPGALCAMRLRLRRSDRCQPGHRRPRAGALRA